ncbi:unnamed protein product, partial [Dovyalis caffra]
DVTFVENKPYFSTPYIPEELPTIVDSDVDLSLDISSSREVAPHERPLDDHFDKVYTRKKDAIPASASKINHLYRVPNLR